MKVKVTQSCPTLCEPMDYLQSMEFSRPENWSRQPVPSPGDLPNPGIEPGSPALQADALLSDPPGKPRFGMLLLLSRFSHVRLCATPQTAAHQAPPSLGFSRQENWSGLPFPSDRHREGNGTPLQYSCLENPMDGGPW